MTDVVIPVLTVWDIIANALDDPWFWLLSALTVFSFSVIIRFRIGRRC